MSSWIQQASGFEKPDAVAHGTLSAGDAVPLKRTRASVLIVEDEAVVARDLERSLQDMGYDVIATVDTGAEALRVAAARKPDLALMDIRLRGAMDGIETSRALREQQDLPVVYLTAFADEVTLARAAETAPYGYLVKPFIGADVRCAVEVALNKHRSDRKLAIASRLGYLGSMAAGVAHEINNPLTYMQMNLEQLGRALELWGGSPLGGVPPWPTPEMRVAMLRALEEVSTGTERIRRIVADLSVFGHVGEDPLRLVDVHACVALALRITTAETRHRASVVSDLGDVPLVKASESRLGLVLVNLISNAVQALPDAPDALHEIRIRTGVGPTGDAVIAVSDDGCGIAPRHLDHLFDPFFTTKDPGRGAGLGLSVCHGIVRALGGSLRVRSELGVGSTFEVHLPAASPGTGQFAQAAPPAQPRRVAHRARVLVIDDEPAVLGVLQRALEDDFDVVTCASGLEALDLLSQDWGFEVVVTDLMMPQVSGMELYEAVRVTNPALASRMVFMTGGIYTSQAGEFVAKISNTLIQKPFTTADLKSQLWRLLQAGADTN